jgi:hypothetical protein
MTFGAEIVAWCSPSSMQPHGANHSLKRCGSVLERT